MQIHTFKSINNVELPGLVPICEAELSPKPVIGLVQWFNQNNCKTQQFVVS